MLTVNRVNEIIKENHKPDAKYSKSPEGIYLIKGVGQTVRNSTEGAFTLEDAAEVVLKVGIKTYIDRVQISINSEESIVHAAINLMRQRAKEFLDTIPEPKIVLNYEFQIPGYTENYCRVDSNNPYKLELRYYLEVFEG